MTNSTQVFLNRRQLLRDGMLLAAGCALAPSIVAETFKDERRCTIANRASRRVMLLHPDTGLGTTELSALTPRIDFVSSSPKGFAQEFSFRCNDQFCSGSGLSFELSLEPGERA